MSDDSYIDRMTDKEPGVLSAETFAAALRSGDLVQPDHEPCQIDHDCEAEPDECWHPPKWWTCRYYQTVDRSDVQTEPCSFGCYDEPNCITGQPTEGWPKD